MASKRELYRDYWSWIPKALDDPPALVFDIETNGLYWDATLVHSIVIINSATGEMFSASSQNGKLAEALTMLESHPLIVGHNVLGYDIPVLRKLYPNWRPRGHVFDTLNAARLIYTNIKDLDFRRKDGFPKKLIGQHKLEAWGHRLGVLKGDFGYTTDWASWSPEMQEYCEQDVRVCLKLYEHILSLGYSPEALALEMEFQKVITEQEITGIPFDVKAAEQLYVELAAKREELITKLKEIFPPKRVESVFIPKTNNKTRGYVKGVPFTKVKYVEFNPGSRQMIAERLIEKYQWEPSEFTATGEPTINDEVLQSLPWPEAKMLLEYFDLSKIIGMLAEGKAGWLKLVTKEGRIHGSVITNGAVTGRCTHNSPNLAQIPRKGDLGRKCRSLFKAPDGWVMVGADASGLELRMFGHYLARYDGGKYIEVILNGDIHTHNQEASGLPTRDAAKAFTYALLYGAGDVKLGSILAPTANPGTQAKKGKLLRNKFMKAIPAYKRLTETIKQVLTEKGPDGKPKRKYLIGIDGRKLHIRSNHAALNTLLQSAGAVLMKLATVIFHWEAEKAGLVLGKDYVQIAHVHDEAQFLARPEHAETVGKLFVRSIELAGKHFGFVCPTTGEYKIGPDWSATH
jgi:DNA polymerase I-like protein with 3'-5' exonuclease and polymerase domains